MILSFYPVDLSIQLIFFAYSTLHAACIEQIIKWTNTYRMTCYSCSKISACRCNAQMKPRHLVCRPSSRFTRWWRRWCLYWVDLRIPSDPTCEIKHLRWAHCTDRIGQRDARIWCEFSAGRGACYLHISLLPGSGLMCGCNSAITTLEAPRGKLYPGSLPSDIPSTLSTFKNHLKTHLFFLQSYFVACCLST